MRFLFFILVVCIAYPFLRKYIFYQKQTNLVLLRAELRELRDHNEIDLQKYEEIIDHIDQFQEHLLHKNGFYPLKKNWLQHRNTAIKELTQYLSTQVTQSADTSISETIDSKIQETPIHRPMTSVSVSKEKSPEAVDRLDSFQYSSITNPTLSDTEETRFAWHVKPPTSIEIAFQKLSGLHRFLIPFLIQHIGWFVSCFFFIAGSIFLISYTAGFVRSFVVTLCLYLYTLLLMIGAYQMLKKRPELRTSGCVLITLDMLLIPLCIAAAVRLFNTGIGNVFYMGMSITVILINFITFYYAAQLGSGIIDRALSKSHTQLFILLNMIQVAIPIVSHVSFWQCATLFHGILVCILIYSLRIFIQDWIHSIFIERKKIAYYAAGTLVFATLTSFVHLSLSYTGLFPKGYFGPFIMVLSGILFYVDFHVKQRVKPSVLLSRLTFVFYGISFMSIAVSFPNISCRIITLFFGAILYSSLVYIHQNYASVYCLSGCLAWIYADVILRHFPLNMYFLSSIPGIMGLMYIHRWTQKRKAIHLGQVNLSILFVLMITLVSISLYHATPGFITIITTLLLTCLLYVILKMTPIVLAQSNNSNTFETQRPQDHILLYETQWFYLIPASVMLCLGYCPVLHVLTWSEQFSVTTVLVSYFWTLFTVKKDKQNPDIRLIHCALVYVGFSIASIAFHLQSHWPIHTAIPAVILLLESGLLLFLCVVLKAQFLFYGCLILFGGFVAILKKAWFPHVSIGMTVTFTAMCIYGFILWLERIPKDVVELLIENHKLRQPSSPLILFGNYTYEPLPLLVLIQMPLNHTLLLLYILGAYKLAYYLNNHSPTVLWSIHLGIYSIFTWFLMIRFSFFYLLPLPVVTGLLSVLTLCSTQIKLNPLSICSIVCAYAITIQIAGKYINQSKIVKHWMMYLGLHEKVERLIPQIRRDSLLTTYFMVFVAAGYAFLMHTNDFYTLIPLSFAMLFLCWSWVQDKRLFWIHHILTMIILSALVIETVLLKLPSGLYVFIPVETSILLLGLALFMGIGAWALKKQTRFQISYAMPLQQVSFVLYVYCLLKAFSLFQWSFSPSFSSHVTIHWVILMFGLTVIACLDIYPELLLKCKGISICVLSSMAVIVLSATHYESLYFFPIGWALMLWIMTNLGLPVLSQRIGLEIDSRFWPWQGLLLILFSESIITGNFPDLFYIGNLILYAIYFFLLLRNSSETILTWIAHGMFLSLFSLIIAVALQYPILIPRMPLCFAICAWNFFINPFPKTASFQKAITHWLYGLPLVSLALLLFWQKPSLPEIILVLIILITVMTGIGLRRDQRFWRIGAQILALIVLHAWPLLFFSLSKGIKISTIWEMVVFLLIQISQFTFLLPWYSFQLTLMMAFGYYIKPYGIQVIQTHYPKIQANQIIHLNLIMGIMFTEWAAHFGFFIHELKPLPPSHAWIQAIPALCTLCIWIGYSIHKTAKTHSSEWVYRIILAISVFLVYVRLLCVGAVSPGIIDTSIIIGYSLSLFLWTRLSSIQSITHPLQRTAIVLPLAALLTINTHSHELSQFLIFLGVYYLSFYYVTRNMFTLYMSIAAFNIAIYSWIPVWSEHVDLIQLYLVPATLSVLLILQLHRRELKRSVLNGTRLAAICSLYTCATVDVMLRPELWVLGLILALSLTGIILGIAMRIRAFLYGGVIFMLINITAQLIRFYPQQALGKGILLIGIGAVILMSMIWFNLKKEIILKQIQLIRTDFDRWD
ncbi:MAG: hypothetical protein HQK77_06705 [Desulfobacterales bacterium]|nr:hypothetical protein [Desulfobacterales bacterium]